TPPPPRSTLFPYTTLFRSSERGDSLLFPALLRIARSEKLQLRLDRDRVFTERKIETEGRTYLSYGNIIYKPPSYPLFGRWHIDRSEEHTSELQSLTNIVCR